MLVRVLKRFCVGFLLIAAVNSSAGEINLPLPSCQLTPIDGGQPYDIQQLKGKVLYVDFWASWCTSCAKSFPFLNGLHQGNKAKGLQIIGVNLDEDMLSAKEFLGKFPAEFPVVADVSKQCATQFSVEAMPSSFLVDKKGVVRYVHLGFRPGETEELQQKVAQLLAEP